MSIPTLYSAKRIEQHFHTGEEPVMVMCSDINLYVCKYMRSSATAYKPQEWKVPKEIVQAKLIQLLDRQWTVDVWRNFMDCLNENIS